MEKRFKLAVILILSILCACHVSCKHKKERVIDSKKDKYVNIIYSEPACFDSIFQSINGVERYVSLVVNENKYLDLLRSNRRINKWISKVDSNKIDVYLIADRGSEYLVLSSEQTESTGLASSFYDWLIINIKENTVTQDDIMSLSKDKRSCFIKDGILHFILFKYGDDFYHNSQDYNNLSLDIIEYTMKDGKLEKSISSNIVCSGK